ncbi:AMP-binding protein [Halorubrum sp. CSM-61]|uniref:AMP-binding protein n=1 Tax=Halorubrum sp. CSM-61 TaxID=2485838 RepID=UPI000F4BDA7E|nr:AMP-binding protein [Halorubrum sp. CSM-61]
MDVVGDLLARDRRSRETALVTADGRERTYRDLITNAYKAANVLRYLGAREGSTVAVEPTPGFHTTLAFLGAAGLGAPVRFDPPAGIERGDRVVLVGVADESTVEPAPGTKLVAFGGPPDRPETTHWEQELWSENPAMPPSDVGPETTAALGSTREFSHRDLCSLAEVAVEATEMDEGTRVVLRRPFSDPPALAAGLVAPLSVGGTAVLAPPNTDRDAGDGDDASDASDGPRGDLAVAPAGVAVPEPRRLDPATLASRTESGTE